LLGDCSWYKERYYPKIDPLLPVSKRGFFNLGEILIWISGKIN
jgi:hypothetical protein